MIYFAVLYQGNRVHTVGRGPDTLTAGNLTSMGAVEISAADYQTMVDDASAWTYTTTPVAYTAPAVTPPPDDIPALQVTYSFRVDEAAENARLKFISPGSGQALEYVRTLEDAQAAVAAPDPLVAASYPWVAAEYNAQVATGVTTTLRAVATQLVALDAAWQSAGVAIKQTRRTAKMAIAAATTKAAMDAIMAGLTWPTPT